jgi:hypothetical protein
MGCFTEPLPSNDKRDTQKRDLIRILYFIKKKESSLKKEVLGYKHNAYINYLKFNHSSTLKTIPTSKIKKIQDDNDV